ncbi:hypothetical protein BDR07DRAFT_1464158 [Suillus spraguei]|nr:hypothetical protein BDR07DRAFT_1464158 [Suillus spraguei]
MYQVSLSPPSAKVQLNELGTDVSGSNERDSWLMNSSIIDDASYWAHTSITVNTAVTHDRDMMYMRMLPLVDNTEGDLLLGEDNLQGDSEGVDPGGLPPAEARWAVPTRAEPFRKIKIELRSHDPGWGGDYDSQGIYNLNGSYSLLLFLLRCQRGET